MRNLGGAIGIALIHSILYSRSGGHAAALRDRLIAGDITAARAIGLDLELFTHRPPDVSDATVEAYLRSDGREGGVCARYQRSLGAARYGGAAWTFARSVRWPATAAPGSRREQTLK